MNSKDARQIGLWAAATAVAVLAATGLPRAIAQSMENLAKLPKTMVGRLEVTATVPNLVAPGDTVTLRIVAKNPGATPATIDGKLTAVRVQFNGNPASRVVTPTDMVRTEVWTRPLKLAVPAKGSKTLDVRFKVPADRATPKNSDRPAPFRSSTYEFVASVNGVEHRLTALAATKRLVDH